MGLLSMIKFSKKKELTIGILGEVNAGKTTLANRIGQDFSGIDVGKVSNIPHETREVSILRNIDFKSSSGRLVLNLVDTPGITSSIDYHDFMQYGLSREEAIERAKAATQGVVKAIQSLNTLDAAIVVVDSARQPFNQVNFTILGNLKSREVPIIVAANKNDLPEANPDLVKDVFQSDVISMSALTGDGVEKLYEAIGRIS